MEIKLVDDFSVSPEVVFAAFTDLDSWHKWMQGLARVEKLTDGAFGLGTRWRETRKIMGKEAFEIFEVTSFEAARAVELYVDGSLGSSKRGEYRFRYAFEPTASGSRMTMHGSITGMGCMGVLLGWLFKSIFRKQMAKDHNALRQYVAAVPLAGK